MPAKVADASVIAAIAFQESAAEDALAALANDDILAPRLLLFELASTAAKKARRRPEESALVLRGLEQVLVFEYQWAEIDAVGVARLALDTGVTASDASYLYVARETHAALVTFDQQLAAAARRLGLHCLPEVPKS